MDAFEEQLGGTVHVFRGCVELVLMSAFCSNGGVPVLSSLASRGALFVESPSCAMHLNSTVFIDNEAPLDGGAVQVCRKLES
jgi:hypothetical protein